MKPDYSKFDAALLDLIANGHNTAGKLDATALTELARPFCTPRLEPFRVIDRRLQALRRAGKIEYINRAWHIANNKKESA